MVRLSRRAVLTTLGSCLLTSFVHSSFGQTAGSSAGGTQTRLTKVGRTPQPADLAQPIEQYFAGLPGYKPGDLVTREATKALLTGLEKAGWKIKDADQLLLRTLPENDFLVREMKTARGRDFLGKIDSVPGGIDQLDRILRMPHGEKNVRQLVQKIPNGHQWIEGMVESAHGRRMTHQMAQSTSGRNFDQATGRIYQVEALQKAVIQSATWSGP